MATRTITARCGRMPSATVVFDKNAINMPRTCQKFTRQHTGLDVKLYQKNT
jgi:hypothetical protein